MNVLLQMIPIENFEAQSMNGNFVPIVPGGGNIHLTYHNRKEYVDKALQFRLHELDQQVNKYKIKNYSNLVKAHCYVK